jgi:ketosteroid isomerase-like protein
MEMRDDQSDLKATEATNVRRLQEQYRAIARGDFQPAIAMMDEAVEFELCISAKVPISGRWRGLAEVNAAMQRNFGSLADQQAELLDVVAQGDTVVLFAEERGKVRATGAPYHIKWAQFFTFRDNKVVRIRGVAAELPHQA